MAISAKKHKRHEGKSDRGGGGGCSNPPLLREGVKMERVSDCPQHPIGRARVKYDKLRDLY